MGKALSCSRHFFPARFKTKQSTVKLIRLIIITTSNDRTYLSQEECNFFTDGINLTIDKKNKFEKISVKKEFCSTFKS